ncbi:MAG: PAS domain S-box protein [Bacteroidetes bacterium]|nr:PAS domain S-box protein [Bacteroidota bacterium]
MNNKKVPIINRKNSDFAPYKTLFEKNPQPMWVYDLESLCFLTVNNAAIESYGYSKDEFLKMTIKDIRPKEDISKLLENISVNRDIYQRSGVWRHLKKDGNIILVEISSHSITFKRKKARLVVIHDVTKREMDSETIRYLASIVESSDDAILGKDLNGIITSWNKGAERVYGYTKEEILGSSILKLFSKENTNELPYIVERIKRGEIIEHYQTVRVRKDGQNIIVSTSISPIKNETGTIVGASAIARDISEKIKAESEISRLFELEKSARLKAEKVQQRLSFLSDASKILSSSLDYEKTLASVANIAIPFLGDWCAIDLINSSEKFNRVAVVHMDPEKVKFVYELRERLPNIQNIFSGINEVIKSGKPLLIPKVTEEFLASFNNIEVVKILLELGLTSIMLVPLRTREKVFGIISLVMAESNRHYDKSDLALAEELATRAAIAIDNSKLFKEAQLLNSELEKRVKIRTEQLETANKELETFSYSVSHDLKAPLRAIEGFTKLLLEDHAKELTEEAQRLLNVVTTNTRNMAQLIEDLLAFSRVSRIQMTKIKFDMTRLVNQVFTELQVLENGRVFEFKLEELSPVNCDPSLLRQVWVNLISNAMKFTRPRKISEIKIGCELKNEEVVYFIKDNGVGFDMRYSQNLFGVFQRLHKAKDFEGTGVGLALVQRIINRHGGRVWAEAKLNEGAAIYFSLLKEKI